jgi:hypothetical protein
MAERRGSVVLFGYSPTLDEVGMVNSRRAGILLTFLYPVLFTEDLQADLPRTIASYRTHPSPELPGMLAELADELAHPTIEARTSDDLLLRFSEAEVRAYLAALVAALADLTPEPGR